MSNQLPVQNMYARGGLYSDTPPLSAPLAHPVPHQPVAQFMPNNSALAVHEDGKIYSLVIDLMDPNTREGALLELSKKREQYDDLALVLWHSFGVFFCLMHMLPQVSRICCRNHAGVVAGDRIRLPSSFSAELDRACIEPRVQCSCPAPVRGVPLGDTTALFKWCVHPYVQLYPVDRPCSPYPTIPLPIPEYNIQNPAIRVPPAYIPWRHRGPCKSELRSIVIFTSPYSSTAKR